MRGDRNLPEEKQQKESIPAEERGRSSVSHYRSGKCLTEEQEASRWIEYCSELYNRDSIGVGR